MDCKNYIIDEFNSLNLRNEDLFVVNYNINSFNKNYDEFSVYISELKVMPNIIILSETKLLGDNTGSIPGFNGVHCNRSSDSAGPGGGIAVYIKNSMHAVVNIENIESLPEIEYIHLKIVYNKIQSISILAFYRPPGTTHMRNFCSKVDELLDAIPNGRKVIMAGDLNINGLNPSINELNFIDAVTSFGLSSHISLPTRYDQVHDSSSQIDHIWTNIESNYAAGVFKDLIATDHCMNFVVFRTNIPNTAIKITFRDHSESNIQLMSDRLSNFSLFFPLLTANLNFNDKFDLFYNEVMRIYKSSCPIKVKTLSTKNIEKPWITEPLRNMIKRKHYVFKRYNDGAVTFSYYNEFKKSVDKNRKNAKRDFLANKYESCNDNSKKCWSLTNKFVFEKNNVKHENFEINHDNRTITDEKHISKIFNEYFVSIGSNLAENITRNNVDPISYLDNQSGNLFYFHPTTPYEIAKIINSFKNKATSKDNLPVFIIKKVIHILSPMLSDLFNESIIHGIFPEKLKVGRVIPLHKTGPKNLIRNYRPITTLSVFSKIFEKLVHKRICSFLKKFNIINSNQFGFLKNKNTSDAILEFLDNCYDSLNDDNFLMTIFLDFSKAFDTISIDILLKKLHHYGFQTFIYSWLRSYLCGRKQFVSIGTNSSETINTVMGVPQGSTLGPLLFIIYISDMHNALLSSKILHFADDSTIYFPYERHNDCSNIINADLERLNIWLSCNKLFLNVDKTKYLIIHNRLRPPDLSLNVGNSVIERTSVHKFLGVHVDEKLTFMDHIDKLCSAVSRNIGVLRKISYFVPHHILRNIYYALIYSKFIYAINCYTSASATALNRISKLIDRALKLVTGENRITNNVCKEHKLFSFSMCRQYFSNIKMYEILIVGRHNYFSQKILNNQSNHHYSTRFTVSGNIRLPFMRYTKCQRSFLYAGALFWDKLPLSIKYANSLSKFKKSLKNYIFASGD